METEIMRNVCYYTFSTICQTLAGAFGFLVAVVLYRLNEIPELLRKLRSEAEAGRGLDTHRAFVLAMNESNWPEVARTLSQAPFADNFVSDDDSKEYLNRQRAKFLRLIDQLEFARRGLRNTLALTGWTIFASLGLLFGSPIIIARLGGWTWLVLIVAWLTMGACLITYYDLAKGVTE